LAEHGFITWVRRTRKTGLKRGEGPQQVQISNAYKIINPAKMAKGVLKSIQSRIANRRKRLAAQANLKSTLTAKTQICRQKAAEHPAIPDLDAPPSGHRESRYSRWGRPAPHSIPAATGGYARASLPLV
jgi:hypothetical protein